MTTTSWEIEYDEADRPVRAVVAPVRGSLYNDDEEDEEGLRSVTIAPCTCGRLIRLATRWERTCRGCGEPIRVGAVGPVTADDCNTEGTGRHGWAIWNHQHGCGTWNTPTEVTVDLADHGWDLDDAVRAGLRRLEATVAEEQAEARRELRERLAELADRAVAHLPQHRSGSCGWDCPIGEGDEPGAFLDGDDAVHAWAWDPTDPYCEATVDVVRPAAPDLRSTR